MNLNYQISDHQQSWGYEEGPWRHRAVKPVMSESRLEQFPVSGYFETSLAATERWGLERISILMRQTADLLLWSQNDSYSEAKLGVHFMKLTDRQASPHNDPQVTPEINR